MTKKDHRYVPIFTHSIKEQKDIIRMIQYIVIVTNLILIAPESNYFLALFLHNVHTINSLFIEEFFTSLKLRKNINLYISVLLISILNMPTHFHLEINWNSVLTPLWVFGQLCHKAQDK